MVDCSPSRLIRSVYDGALHEEGVGSSTERPATYFQTRRFAAAVPRRMQDVALGWRGFPYVRRDHAAHVRRSTPVVKKVGRALGKLAGRRIEAVPQERTEGMHFASGRGAVSPRLVRDISPDCHSAISPLIHPNGYLSWISFSCERIVTPQFTRVAWNSGQIWPFAVRRRSAVPLQSWCC